MTGKNPNADMVGIAFSTEAVNHAIAKGICRTRNTSLQALTAEYFLQGLDEDLQTIPLEERQAFANNHLLQAQEVARIVLGAES